MIMEGKSEGNQPGLVSQDLGDVSTCSGKRCRDESEEELHAVVSKLADPCGKATDLDALSDAGPSGSDGNGLRREDQAASIGVEVSTQPEKRMKCVPHNMECVIQPLPSSKDAEVLDATGNTRVSGDEHIGNGTVVTNQNGYNEGLKKHSGTEEPRQFYCDACSVKCTSSKDFETHVSGKKHARAKKLAMVANCSNTEAMAMRVSIEDTNHPVLNAGVVSMGQQVLSDGSNINAMEIQAFKEDPSSCPALHDAHVVSVGECVSADCSDTKAIGNLASKQYFSRCPASNDAHAGALGQIASADCSNTEAVENQASKKYSSSSPALNDDHVGSVYQHVLNETFCQHVSNETLHNTTCADGTRKESDNRSSFEGRSSGNYMTSLMAKVGGPDCVMRALASGLSAAACPGLEGLQIGTCKGQASGGSELKIAEETSSDSHGIVKMHALCFLNLLKDVRTIVTEDLLCQTVISGERNDTPLTTKVWCSNPPASASVVGELNCKVCRVEDGSKSEHTRCQLCNKYCNSEKDFENHLAGKKHASKLRLMKKRVPF